MSTQSKKIAIQLGTFNGLSFTPISEYETPKVYDVWNMTSDWNVEWLKASARQRALEGRDRPGVGGFRYEARITFRTMLPAQAKAIRDLLNDIFEDPLFPHIVKISEDEDISNGVLCNLRSSAYGIRRELTVGRQAVNMEFANLFRLNMVTDVPGLKSNGKYVTTNYSTGLPANVIFRYRDIDGSLIAEQSGTIASAAYYGLEWLGDEKFVYCDGSGRVAVLDINSDTGNVTRTQLGDFPGGSEDLDLDEFGNIYTNHLSSTLGVRKTSLDGSSSMAAGSFKRKVYVDDQYIYTHDWGTVIFEKRDRDTLSLVASSEELSYTAEDVSLIYPDELIQLRVRTTNPSLLRRFRKSDMVLIETLNLNTVTGMSNAFQIRMVYDENGKIYILQYNSDSPETAQVVEMDTDFNVLSINDVSGGIAAKEIAIAPTPINRIYISTDSNTYVYDMGYNLVGTFSGTGPLLQNRGRFLNVHPGRAQIKFHVLGLTKQF